MQISCLIRNFESDFPRLKVKFDFKFNRNLVERYNFMKFTPKIEQSVLNWLMEFSFGYSKWKAWKQTAIAGTPGVLFSIFQVNWNEDNWKRGRKRRVKWLLMDWHFDRPSSPLLRARFQCESASEGQQVKKLLFSLLRAVRNAAA